MKTGNKILLTGATLLVASILVNIGTVLHGYRAENAYTRHLDSLLQQRPIRVLVELKHRKGPCYRQFQSREEQEEKGSDAVTLLLFQNAPATPETARIEGDTLFLDAPVVGGLPTVTRFIRSDGQELDVHGLALTTKEIPRIKEREIN